MRPIHTTKRLYSIAASPPLKATVRPTPTSPRPRRASLSLASAVGSPSTSSTASTSSSTVVGSSGNRSLYTNATGSLPFFDSASPPPPLPTSRPSNPHSFLSPRLPAGEAQPQATQGSTHGNNPSANSAQTPHSPHFANGAQSTQQNSHGQGHHGQTSGSQQTEGSNQPLFGTSLMLSLGEPTPPTGSSPPDYGFFLGGPRSGLAADYSWHSRESVADGADRQVKEDQNIIDASSTGQKMYQLDVGAYGIPKRGRVSTRARPCSCTTCLEGEDVYASGSLENAVQVGEDAYFIREDALGVADGVGGWSSRASSSRTSSSIHSCSTCAAASTSTSASSVRHTHAHKHYHKASISQPSPSALFARRLMHFCSQEVGEARASATNFSPPQPDSISQNPDIVTKTTKPSLKDGGISPRATTINGRRKTVVREHGNARPFNWPWESDSSTTGLEALPEEDHPIRPLDSRTPVATDAKQAQNPLDGTVDPVDVLERAYSKTINAHRVRRRVRVVKTLETPPRWWSYSLGLGSTAPKAVSSTSADIASVSVEKSEDSEWEWQEIWEPLNSGSSTALLAVLSGDRLRVAHLGDCIGWLVRGGEIVWRSEEMWWDFNYPVQLGPASPTRPSDARRYELSVQADDILILASDGMSDNCWEEDVLDEVRRAVEAHLPVAKESDRNCDDTGIGGLLGRRTLAAMLSEALCSRARQSSTQMHGSKRTDVMVRDQEVEELPFERRAREEGRSFRGGKSDDISVLVAIISPVQKSSTQTTSDSENDGVAPGRQSEVASPVTE